MFPCDYRWTGVSTLFEERTSLRGQSRRDRSTVARSIFGAMPLSVLMRSASPLRWFNHYCSASEAVLLRGAEQ